MSKQLWIVCIACVLAFQSTHACTGIIRKATNGDTVFARTMEFSAEELAFNLSYVPRGIEYAGQTPSGQPGLKWKTKYAHVGFSPWDLPIIADGLNEKGVAAGLFYFPGWAKFQEPLAQDTSNTLSNIDLVSWVLGNFEKVSQVRDALKQVRVAGVVLKQWGVVPEVHYIVVDATGDRIVIEYVAGELTLYDAPIGVITNAPTYDWHQTNARNYIGLSALNSPATTIDGHELSQFGQGSGALGLPGDFTPPSRFIRAGFLNQVVYNGASGSEEIETAFKILNQFDIPKGAVKASLANHKLDEETQWTSASDLTARRYYFHTATNRTIKMVDLLQVNPNAKAITTVAIDDPETILDISPSLSKKG